LLRARTVVVSEQLARRPRFFAWLRLRDVPNSWRAPYPDEPATAVHLTRSACGGSPWWQPSGRPEWI